MPREVLDISNLPPVAQSKLTALKEAANAALALSREVMERVSKAREQLEFWELRVSELRRPQARLIESVSRDGRTIGPPLSMTLPHGLPDDDPAMVEALRQLKNAEKEVARLSVLYEERNATWTHAGQLSHALEKYVKHLNGSAALYDGDEGPPKFKGLVTDAIETRRRRLRELQADRRRVQTAPRPSSVVKDQIKSWVELLQERGIPRLLPLVEEGRFDAVKVAETSSQYPVFMSGGDRVGGVIVSVPDLLATFAWLDPTKLLKRLNAEVDELSDDEHALTDAQRAEQLAEIESDRLATEREEEHLIELAEGQGLNIARRTEADPRAVLGLSSELPSPREH